MSFSSTRTTHPIIDQKVERLQNFHRSKIGWVSTFLFFGLCLFALWAVRFNIAEVARSHGEVIATSRVQVIQAVDGGVLAELDVREGDRVSRGDILARLDVTRINATVAEIEANLYARQVQASRLRAEVKNEMEPNFPPPPSEVLREQMSVERALFLQRKEGLAQELNSMKVAVGLAVEKLRLVEELHKLGDASGSEILIAKNAVNDAQARIISRENEFFERASTDLARAEGEISQLEQKLARSLQERADTVFRANVPGIVKNVSVTTLGGVLRAGDEIMQIVPVEDDLIVEAKVSPADIARLRKGLEADIKLDPFDYTIYGGVSGVVVYVSADTIKETTSRGDEIYYRVHVKPSDVPVVTNIGKSIEILPGMTAQVDIRTGERSVMDYLLKPLRKTLMESMGER